MRPPHRPSKWWWKCSACKAELHRSKQTHGACWCWTCRAITLPSAQIALWGHEWKLVAWMALAMTLDTVDWDNAEYVTSLFDDPITERWVGGNDTYYVPDQFLPKE